MSSTNKRALLIFDFDGTIADTAEVVLDIANDIFKDLGMKSVDQSDFERLKAATPKEVVKDLGIPLKAIPKLITTIKAKLKERIDDIDPVDGMTDVLQELTAIEECDLAILSSNTPDNIDFFLKKYQLQDMFSEVESNVGVFNKRFRLRRLIRSAQADSDTVVVYIGDEVRDVEAAKKAGVISVAVTWGLNAEVLLERAEAEHIVHTSDQLKQTLTSLVQ